MATLFENDLKALLPEVFLVFALSFLLIFGSIYGTRKMGEKGSPILISPMVWLSSQSLFLAAVLSFHGKFQEKSLLYGSLYFDSLAVNGKGSLFLVTALCLIASRAYLNRQGIFAFEYPLLILLSTFAMGLLISSYDLLALYLALELQSLGLYVLATFQRGSAYSTEAGLKYFVVGAFSSGLLLFGISLIYGSTGTTSFEDLSRILLDAGELSTGIQGGLIFLSAGLLFKIAAVPFHMWIPDVYEGSPTSSTLFFAAIPKLAIIGSLVRLYYFAFYPMIFLWQGLLIFVSASSMILAALAALYQRKIKRFLAYSSIGHVGYLLIGLSSGSLEGLESMILYLLIYMLMTLNLWTVLLTTARWKEGSHERSPMKYMDELQVLGKLNPALAVTVGVAIFSMAGIPPMAGFCAKMYVFFSAMESSLYGLAIVGVLTTVVAAYYYLRWLKIMYFEKEVKGFQKSPYTYEILVDREKALLLSTTSFFMLFFFANPSPLLVMAHEMALSLSL